MSNKTPIAITATRLDPKTGKPQCEVERKIGSVTKRTWEFNASLVKDGYRDLILAFDETTNRGRSSYASPRLRRTRTRSPTKSPRRALLTTPRRSTRLSENEESKPDSTSSEEEKDEDPVPSLNKNLMQTYQSINLPSQFWLRWCFLMVLGLLISLLAQIFQEPIQKRFSFLAQVEAVQLLISLPTFLCTYAIVKNPSENVSKGFRHFNVIILSLLVFLVFLEAFNSSSFIPDQLVSSVKTVTYLLVTILLYHSSHQIANSTSSKAQSIEIFISLVLFIVLSEGSNFRKLNDLSFSQTATLWIASSAFTSSAVRVLASAETSLNGLYFLCAHASAFCLTALFVLGDNLKEDFGRIDDIFLKNVDESSGEKFMLKIDTFLMMKLLLQWVFAGVLTFLAVDV